MTYEVAEMVLALEFSAAFVVALPHWIGTSEIREGTIRIQDQKTSPRNFKFCTIL